LPLGLALLAGGIAWRSAPAAAVTIELNDVAADRVERQRAFTEGSLPLPGTPDLSRLEERLEQRGLKIGAPLFIRIFKAESELEVWLRQGDHFVLLDTYPICHWSGTTGPKLSEGDMQNPEGFYAVGTRQLHRSGRWPRSFNLGYPNRYDRALLRTGSYILVHGGCSSSGCFAMTDPVMDEIYKLARAALRAGQSRIHVHVFPFRMTEPNLAAQAESPWMEFWQDLKQGYDAFAATGLPPRVSVCERHYVVEPAAPQDPANHAIEANCRTMRNAAQAPSPRALVNGSPELASDLAGEAGDTAVPAGEPGPVRAFVRMSSNRSGAGRHTRTSNDGEPMAPNGARQRDRD
jgi:murein L,D-transpeptidase YafK